MRPFPLLSLVLLPLLLGATEPPSLERYAGSFRLETGETITGGPFIERSGDPVSFLYLDPIGLDWALFRRESPMRLRSVQPPGITLRFLFGEDGSDRIVWTGPNRSVEGRRTFPHRARSLTIPSNGVELDARLLLPECRGPHPLVVLVGGSGPTTRWGGTFDTFFISLGMAVLTYDKRGVGEPDWSEPDLEDLAADAAAAYRTAAIQPEVDVERIGFWGSSQGGWTAPMAAAQTDPAFLIVRVGPGVTEMEAHLHELRQEMRAEGLSGIDLDHASSLRRELYELALAGKPLTATDAVVEPFLEEEWYATAFGEGPVSERWSQRWWSWAQRNFPIEPGTYIARLDTPILWFLAEKDENVPFVPSHVGVRRAFAASPSQDETLVTIAGAKHSFDAEGGEGQNRYVSGYWSRMKQWLGDRGLSNESCWRDR